MKLLIFSVISAIIISKSYSPLPFCNLDTAKLAIEPRIFQETTIDGPKQNVILTRFLHNKLGIYGSELSRCYFNSLDPNFISKNLSLIGLVSILFLLYRLQSQKNFAAIFAFLFLPLLPILGFPYQVTVLFFKIFAIIGVGFILRNS
jgi:hypothetical protein